MKHIIFGLVAVLMGIWGIIVWWDPFGAVMRGLVPFLLLMFGIIAILAGLQVQQASEKEDNVADDEVEEKEGEKEEE